MKSEKTIKWQVPGSDTIHEIPEGAKVWFECPAEYCEISFVEDAEGNSSVLVETQDL